MGSGHSIACNTCKKDYYLGYGGYSSFERCFLPKFPKAEHEGHEYFHYTEDFTDYNEKTGHLMSMSGPGCYDVIFAENFKDYEYIDLSGEACAFSEF